jgi:hypothetical protein
MGFSILQCMMTEKLDSDETALDSYSLLPPIASIARLRMGTGPRCSMMGAEPKFTQITKAAPTFMSEERRGAKTKGTGSHLLECIAWESNPGLPDGNGEFYH